MQVFGGTQAVRSKGDVSNVVTDADLASERIIVDGIRRAFPTHSIIAEETGYVPAGSEFTWVVDPLDGTSNFAAGIPWFGVLIAVLRAGRPVAAVLHLPAMSDLYVAEAGSGAYRNGNRVTVTKSQALHEVLWAYGMDAKSSQSESELDVRLLFQLLGRVRNIRATNSLVDAAFTADGRLGGVLNRSTRVWDIAAPMLIVQEAGGLYTDARGQPLVLDVSPAGPEKQYAVLAGAPHLHAEVAALVRSVENTRV